MVIERRHKKKKKSVGGKKKTHHQPYSFCDPSLAIEGRTKTNTASQNLGRERERWPLWTLVLRFIISLSPFIHYLWMDWAPQNTLSHPYIAMCWKDVDCTQPLGKDKDGVNIHKDPIRQGGESNNATVHHLGLDAGIAETSINQCYFISLAGELALGRTSASLLSLSPPEVPSPLSQTYFLWHCDSYGIIVQSFFLWSVAVKVVVVESWHYKALNGAAAALAAAAGAQ